MKRLPLLLIFSGTLMLLFQCEEPKNKDMNILDKAQEVTAPQAAKKDTILTQHGDERNDPYYWLNERNDPEVKAHLDAENTYLDSVMGNLRGFRDTLFKEIKSRIAPNDSSAPYLKNGYYYYVRYEEGLEHPIYARKKGSLDADEEIMLNVNDLAEGYAYYQVTGLSVSPNNRWLSYGVDTLSRRIYTIYFKDLESGETLETTIQNTTGQASWANDNKTVFFSRKDATLRPFQIWRQNIHDEQSIHLVYEEKDPTFVCYVDKSKSDKYLFIASSATKTTEYRVIPADAPDQKPEVFHPRERGLEYDIDHLGNTFYVLTNWEAENFRVMTCGEQATGKANWEEKIAHREDILVQDIELFEGGLAVSERVEGISKIALYDWKDAPFYVDFDEEAYTSYLGINEESDSRVIRIQYTSMTTPMSSIDYHVDSGKLEVIKEQDVRGSFAKENYQSERIYVTARDGKEVPVSLVYHKDLDRSSPQPLFLYGYGSYGYSIDPYFSHVRLSLLDRGVIFAIAHIRGGEDMGRKWYEDGKLMNKKNTFTDFIDVASFFVDEKYTQPDQLLAMGGSAGGLLMGAVVNMRPDLFRGIVAAVPFVDVVTTMLDESIPLTTGEYDEWGNPNEKEAYEYIKSYSPYDNVTDQKYPAILATTGLHDSQVQYWEPAKWVARLRDHQQGEAPILLYTNMDTGHGGASGRFERYKDTAMEYAFLLDLVGKVQ
jgi:oligopeptidase B